MFLLQPRRLCDPCRPLLCPRALCASYARCALGTVAFLLQAHLLCDPLCAPISVDVFGPVRVRLLTIHLHMERYQAKRLVVGHLLTCLGNQKNTSREHVRVFQHMQHLHLARTATCSSGCVFRIHNVSYDIHLKDREVNPSLPES